MYPLTHVAISDQSHPRPVPANSVLYDYKCVDACLWSIAPQNSFLVEPVLRIRYDPSAVRRDHKLAHPEGERTRSGKGGWAIVKVERRRCGTDEKLSNEQTQDSNG